MQQNEIPANDEGEDECSDVLQMVPSGLWELMVQFLGVLQGGY